MKTFTKICLLGAGLAASLYLLHAQPAGSSARAVKNQAADDLAAMLEAVEQTRPVPAKSLPPSARSGTYWSAQHAPGSRQPWPPLPANVLGLDVWPLGKDNCYLLDDRKVVYPDPEAETAAGSAFRFGGGYGALMYSTNDLWLEIISVNLTNQLADLLLHNTTDTKFYQLLSKTNLLQSDWVLGEIKTGDYNTNETLFAPVNIGGNPTMFFRAHQADWQIGIYAGSDAVEPHGIDPGRSSSFTIYGNWASGTTNNVAVYYRASGTASNGVDYLALSGLATLTNGSGQAAVAIQPLADNFMEGGETITLTIIPTNTYLTDPSAQGHSATLNLWDTATTVSIFSPENAIEPDGPPGVPPVIGHVYLVRYDFRNFYTNLAVKYLISGTASNGVDYQFLSGTVNFAPEMDLTNIDITPLKDNLPEGLETVTFTLLPTNTYDVFPGGGTVNVTINDSTTTVSLGVVQPNTAVEPDGPPGAPAVPAQFLVHREDARFIFTNLAVRYVVSGTASNGADYLLLSGTVNFEPEMQDTNIVVMPLADNVLEGLETVTVTLLDLATNGYYIDTNNPGGTVTINDSSTTLSIAWAGDAVEPLATNSPGQTGIFQVFRTDTRDLFPSLTFRYSISGTAANGIDYSNLSGVLTFAPDDVTTNIFVKPLADDLIFEGTETVTLTLIANPTNLDGYLISSSNATVNIADAPAVYGLVTNIIAPIGIDYHAPSNSLIVSYNYSGGGPFNFARVYTNVVVSNSVAVATNLIATNWTRVSGSSDEVKLATVKVTSNGFTNGETFFGSGSAIGWLSADGTRSNLTWSILTNAAVVNALPIRGSLYMDQTGIFGNQLIVVASDSGASGSRKGVWRVNAQGQPTLLTNLATLHLEGVITLPNDTNKWGPWAGKIITGDEDSIPNALIYSINTNGAVVSYITTNFIPGGIKPEDFDIIPTNQDLYISDTTSLPFPYGSIVKLPKKYFANNVGDLLITSEIQRKFFVVHWSTNSNTFIVNSTDYTGSSLEHVTFAPIDLPAH